MTAPNGQEIEIKFAVHNRAQLEAALHAAGFELQNAATFESNTLFDDAADRLRNGDQVLRLREFGGRWLLTHKSRGTAARHKVRQECETAVADGAQMRSILEALGYRAIFRYEKYRATWNDGLGEVVIDETPVGVFGEIEGAPDWIDRTAAKLGLAEHDYITDSYAQLFLQWRKRTGSTAQNMTFAECHAK